MRCKGTIIEWRDDRGFGFIEPNGGGERIFCHVTAFAVRVRRPAAGDAVTYGTIKDKQGRLQATDVRPSGLERAAYKANVGSQRVTSRRETRAQPPLRSATPSYAFVVVFAATLVVMVAYGRVNALVPAVYIVMSGITFFAYAFDKSAAMNKRWRTQEQTLHLFALAGGWPGGLIAQNLFRHKIAKTSFKLVFWVCVVANLAALATLARLLSWSFY